MNKTELKNFAINSRLELLSRVRDRAALYGITEENSKANSIMADELFQKVDGSLLSKKEAGQRKALVERIQNNGFVQVMEEAAYIWFNRFIALRYMEEHNLLPVDVRVIPQKAGDLPQIVREAQNASFEGVDLTAVLQLLDDNKSEDLYKYLIITMCNNLSTWLPQMFEKINDYTELLFPDGLLKSDSFLGLLAGVEEDNWQDIQVIGWLYQYYNTELKDETFALLKKNVKITKDRIGAATQLFTPEWIVRYMVENSLGRLWYEGHPDASLRIQWQYYFDESQQDTGIENSLAIIKEDRKKLKLEKIKILDPCMGSGHILVYAFDVLMQIYRSIGYTDRDAVRSIIENNLYGLDIDDRATQLAYFALMMKASEYDKRFIKRGIQPNICSIQESNTLSEFASLRGQITLDKTCINIANQLIWAFVDAKEYGSLLNPQVDNLPDVNQLMDELKNAAVKDLEVSAWFEKARTIIPQLAKQAAILQNKYDVVVTNPPYIGRKGMNDKISAFLDEVYPSGKMDMFASFILKCRNLTKNNSFFSLMTPFVWTTLSSYTGLREEILKTCYIACYLQPEENSFKDAAVSICSFTMCKSHNDYIGKYVKLSDYSEPNQQPNEVIAIAKGKSSKYFFTKNMKAYESFPGYKYLFWASERISYIFSNMPELGSVCATRQGMATTNNDLFLRLWYEVCVNNIGFGCTSQENAFSTQRKWFPFNKGGGFRKWYGNNEYVVNFANNGKEICDYIDNTPGARVKSNGRVINRQYYFLPCITWSDICGRTFAARDCEKGFIFSIKGSSGFTSPELHHYILALMNSYVSITVLNMINPSITTNVGDVKQIPFVLCNEEQIETVKKLAIENIQECKADWDSFETSWDFKYHPLIKEQFFCHLPSNSKEQTMTGIKTASTIESHYQKWMNECEHRFEQLKSNEEKLNRIFIDAYGLQSELSPEVEDKDVTVRKADLGRDIRSLISYAVGCMLGRYSLDEPGLVYAGGNLNPSKYYSYEVDPDGILPITDDEYFQDDIVSMFIRWVKYVYGDETLEANLQFIANALKSSNGSSREVIRSYFMNDFYQDHIKIYQKRPIYWQFDSGNQNGFKAIMYLHRYNQDTIAKLRTEYVHELQDRYRTQLDDAQKTAESGDARQRVVASKRALKLEKQLEELNKYEELVHHYADMRISLDLDDGVKVNYAKLQEILTPIK